MARATKPKSPDTTKVQGEATSPPTAAQARGLKLKAWMAERKISNAQLARISEISEMAISKYVRGVSDIGRMTPPTITQLLSAMYVSDSWAWDYFDIPEEQRGTWRSLRAGDMGPPEDAAATYVMVLPSASRGDWILPAGAIVTIERSDTQAGPLVATSGDTFWIASRDFLPANAVIVGRFKSAAAPADA